MSAPMEAEAARVLAHLPLTPVESKRCNIAAPPEIRLKRFIHYGSEEAVYQPGKRVLKADKIKSVEALINRGKALESVNHIIKAYMDGYVAHKDALIFALAVCAKQKTSIPLKQAAYTAIEKICITSQDLFFFIKSLRDLDDKNSTGHGWKRVVSDWYLKKSSMDLADLVAKHRGHYHWTHKDIFKLTHLKTDDVAKRAVLCYVLRGLKEANALFGNERDAQQVLQLLQSIEDLKHAEDSNVATRLLESQNLTIDHVPSNSNLLKSKEIWSTLIPTMSINKLLDCLQSLSIHGLLKGTSTPIVRRYCDTLNNPEAVAESGITPARVYIELRTYELKAKEKVALAVKLNPDWASKRLSGNSPKSNSTIVDALNNLFNSSFKMLIPTGLRYLIAIDGRERMWVNRCYHSRYVTLGEAAVLVALNLIKTELDIVFGTFTGQQGHFTPIPVTKESTMIDITTKVKGVTVSQVPPIVTNVFNWAENNKKQIDVFIVLGDNTLQVQRVSPELMRYRRIMQLQNTKIISCGLNGPFKKCREAQGNGQLCIFGFDKHIPRVIEAFSRGAF